jgi:microcin C transport system substrate-binding protein
VTVLGRFAFLLFGIGLFVGGCRATGPESGTPPIEEQTRRSAVPSNKDDYPVFPDADAGADPRVPAQLGGKGFQGEGWQTNTTFGLIGDPRAVKGGTLREAMGDFPGTLRLGGPEWNTTTNFMIGNTAYESLLAVDPTTLEYIPALATHWQILPDRMTFRYRLDPNGRWPDGQPVTAEDVVATWKLYTDPGLNDLGIGTQLRNLDKPTVESKYIVRVQAKTLDWKHFLTFATFVPIFPAAVLEKVDGAAYLRDYNFKYLPGTGPYEIRESDIRKGTSLTLRRRANYWAKDARRNIGLNNFDEIRLTVVRDATLTLEMFKRGDLDSIGVGRPQTWLEDLAFDKVDRGLIQKQKVFNNSPRGFGGFAFNTRRKPFADLRVRKALTLLFNRRLILEKLYLNEFVPMNSYYSATMYENPKNPRNEYDPAAALTLLADAGWNGRDTNGRLTKDGVPLAVEMLYDSKGSEAYLTIYQEDLRKVGITLSLRLVTGATRYKLMGEHQFDVVDTSWGASAFPDPEGEFHSRLADASNTNNVTGFSDPRIDAICEAYARTFDQRERVALLQELDGVLTSHYHYVLRWYSPSQRIAYWNKFGRPPGTVTRTGLFRGDLNLGPGIQRLWWIDGDRARLLEQAMVDNSVTLEASPAEDRYWQ